MIPRSLLSSANALTTRELERLVWNGRHYLGRAFPFIVTALNVVHGGREIQEIPVIITIPTGQFRYFGGEGGHARIGPSF